MSSSYYRPSSTAYASTWHLNRHRSVVATKNEVFFINNSDSRSTRIMLTKEAFENFHELTFLIKRKPLPFRFPLDRRVWLSFRNSVQLYVNSSYNDTRIFRFTPESWTQYMKFIHTPVRSFLRNGRSRRGENSQSFVASSSSRRNRVEANNQPPSHNTYKPEEGEEENTADCSTQGSTKYDCLETDGENDYPHLS